MVCQNTWSIRKNRCRLVIEKEGIALSVRELDETYVAELRIVWLNETNLIEHAALSPHQQW